MGFKSGLRIFVTIVMFLAGSGNLEETPAKATSGYGENCSLTKCSDTLHCTNEICSCLSPDYQSFDNKTGLCQGLVTTRCGTGKDKCIYGAICSNSRCTCGPDFIELDDGRCGKSHGKDCSQTGDVCATPNFVCREGRCGCRNGEDVFERKSGTCLRPLGYLCDNSCVENAIRTFTSKVEGSAMNLKKTCQCMPGFKSSDDQLSCLPTGCQETLFSPVTKLKSVEDAFPVGKNSGEVTYSCRVKTAGQVSVGTALFLDEEKYWICWYGWNGLVVMQLRDGFEVLTKPRAGVDLSWLAGNKSAEVPDQGVSGELGNQFVIRCNDTMDGAKVSIPGKLLVSKIGNMPYYTWEFKAKKCKEFEVLVCSKKQ